MPDCLPCGGKRPLSASLPSHIEAEITYTEPGVKGDTATNTLKPATIDTGAEVRVPLFINIGDRIKVDTRTGDYSERVKSKPHVGRTPEPETLERLRQQADALLDLTQAINRNVPDVDLFEATARLGIHRRGQTGALLPR